MIAATRRDPRPELAVVCAAAAVVLASCQGPGSKMNSVEHADWLRQLTGAESERRHAEAELWTVRERTRHLREEERQARQQLAEASRRETETGGRLERVLASLKAMEEDLKVARDRRTAIEAELAQLRGLEAELAKRRTSREQVLQQSRALDAELAKARADLEAKQAAVADELAALKAKVEQLRAAEQTVRQVLEPAPAAAKKAAPAGAEAAPKPASEKPPAPKPAGAKTGGKAP